MEYLGMNSAKIDNALFKKTPFWLKLQFPTKKEFLKCFTYKTYFGPILYLLADKCNKCSTVAYSVCR